jgi:F-type H+-transporting ATPase subunit delta
MKGHASLRAVARAFAEVLTATPGSQRARALAACARYLQQQRLLHRSPAVLELLDEGLLARAGIRRANVRSADPLSAAESGALERVLGSLVGGPVTARVAVRPALLAGFRAEVGGLLVDASVRGALARIRARVQQSRHG